MSWGIVEAGSVLEQHVVPWDDVRDAIGASHEASRSCFCGPTATSADTLDGRRGYVFTHHQADWPGSTEPLN